MKYEYKCINCGKEYFVDIPISKYEEEKDKQFCSCGKKLTRYFSSCNFILKGHGWARDGYGTCDTEMKNNNFKDKKLEDTCKTCKGC